VTLLDLWRQRPIAGTARTLDALYPRGESASTPEDDVDHAHDHEHEPAHGAA